MHSMQYKVLEPIFDRVERKFYAVGSVVTLSKTRIKEITEQLEATNEKLEDYLLKIESGDKNEPTTTTTNVNERKR